MAWLLCLVGVVATGILSRVVHTGFVVLDKYLGDVLYAAMFYLILRRFRTPVTAALSTMALMTAGELFQLTMIPAHMMASRDWMVRICARLLGTDFSGVDLLAYGVGVVCCYLGDSSREKAIGG